VRGLKSARETKLDHRRRDRDLQDDDREQSPRATIRRSYHPPGQITGQRVREQPVRPVNRCERAGVRDNLPVAQRKAAAGRHCAQVRRQRAE